MKYSFRMSWRDILVVLLLLVTFIMPVVFRELMSAETSLSRLFSSILYTLLLACMIAFLHRKWLFVSLSAIVMLTSFVETMMVLLYSNYLTAGNILAILTTNTDEGGGFILGTLHKIPYALPVILSWIGAIGVYQPNNELKKNLLGGDNSVNLSCASVSFLSVVCKVG